MSDSEPSLRQNLHKCRPNFDCSFSISSHCAEYLFLSTLVRSRYAAPHRCAHCARYILRRASSNQDESSERARSPAAGAGQHRGAGAGPARAQLDAWL